MKAAWKRWIHFSRAGCWEPWFYFKQPYVTTSYQTSGVLITRPTVALDTHFVLARPITIYFSASYLALFIYVSGSTYGFAWYTFCPGSSNNHLATCKSNNLIYLITCKKCLAQYVGETQRPLHMRMYEHLYSIRSKKDTPVGIHFNRTGHSTSDVRFEVASFIYSHVPPDSEEGKKIRKSVEKLWIHRMKTNRSPRLNILD